MEGIQDVFSINNNFKTVELKFVEIYMPGMQQDKTCFLLELYSARKCDTIVQRSLL